MTFRSLAVAVAALSLAACASGPDVDDLLSSIDSDESDESDQGSAAEPAVDAGARDAGKAPGTKSSGTSTTDAGKATSTASTASPSSSSGGSPKDAGSTPASPASMPIRADAGAIINPLDILTGLLGGATSSASDAGKPTGGSGDGGVDHCGPDLFCFDIFDCAIFHPDALDCGFTKCEGFVCKK